MPGSGSGSESGPVPGSGSINSTRLRFDVCPRP